MDLTWLYTTDYLHNGKSSTIFEDFVVLDHKVLRKISLFSVVVLNESPCPRGSIYKSLSLFLSSDHKSLCLSLDHPRGQGLNNEKFIIRNERQFLTITSLVYVIIVTFIEYVSTRLQFSQVFGHRTPAYNRQWRSFFYQWNECHNESCTWLTIALITVVQYKHKRVKTSAANSLDKLVRYQYCLALQDLRTSYFHAVIR